MSKDDRQPALVPRLRFPEFRESGAWKFRPLKAVGSRVNERNSDESISRVLTNSAEHGVLDQRDFFEKDIAVAGKLDNYFVVEEGDYVYNPRISRTAPVGPISRNNVGQGVMSPLYTVFRLGEDGTDFHEHYFATSGWHDYLRSVSSTGARHDRMSIGITDFMNMPIPLPDPAEQRKIADCLGSLDDLISAEGRKLAALRDHKQGLMQQLFPRQGETQPRLRFPEFRNAGEWNEKQLREVGEIVTGKTPSTKDSSNWSGGVPFITPTDIDDLGKYQTNTARTVAEQAVRTLLPSGAIVYTCIASIGKMAMTVRPSVTNQQINSVIPRPEYVSEFIYYILQNLTPWIQSIPASSTLAIINKTEFSQIPVSLPSPQEQQLIADCLSALDAWIAAQAEKLDALRTHKCGLMQQLFPSPEDTA